MILVGLAGAFFFSVFVQHVTPGAFAAGLTLITGATDVVIALVKAALFGLAAGLIACYKGISVGGGPAGVGNAVNETVVFTFMALFAINIVATAVSVKVDAMTIVDGRDSQFPAADRAVSQLSPTAGISIGHADPVLRPDPALDRTDVLRPLPRSSCCGSSLRWAWARGRWRSSAARSSSSAS